MPIPMFEIWHWQTVWHGQWCTILTVTSPVGLRDNFWNMRDRQHSVWQAWQDKTISFTGRTSLFLGNSSTVQCTASKAGAFDRVLAWQTAQVLYSVHPAQRVPSTVCLPGRRLNCSVYSQQNRRLLPCACLADGSSTVQCYTRQSGRLRPCVWLGDGSSTVQCTASKAGAFDRVFDWEMAQVLFSVQPAKLAPSTVCLVGRRLTYCTVYTQQSGRLRPCACLADGSSTVQCTPSKAGVFDRVLAWQTAQVLFSVQPAKPAPSTVCLPGRRQAGISRVLSVSVASVLLKEFNNYATVKDNEMLFGSFMCAWMCNKCVNFHNQLQMQWKWQKTVICCRLWTSVDGRNTDIE